MGRREVPAAAEAGGCGACCWERRPDHQGDRTAQDEQRGHHDGGQPATSAALLGTGHQVLNPRSVRWRCDDAAPAHRRPHRQRAAPHRRRSGPRSRSPAVLPPPVSAAPYGMLDICEAVSVPHSAGEVAASGSDGNQVALLALRAAGSVAGSRPCTTMTPVPPLTEASVAASRVKVRL